MTEYALHTLSPPSIQLETYFPSLGPAPLTMLFSSRNALLTLLASLSAEAFTFTFNNTIPAVCDYVLVEWSGGYVRSPDTVLFGSLTASFFCLDYRRSR